MPIDYLAFTPCLLLSFCLLHTISLPGCGGQVSAHFELKVKRKDWPRTIYSAYTNDDKVANFQP